ncbi:sugar kinase [Pasteurella bettyae]|uniref:sugar kinase n=1 Tax=Pasteurella bettyae TaxID=752 RepID=UPI003D28CBF4
MKKLAIIGECMIELNGEPFGNMRQTYGGDSLNTATYLARITPPNQIEVRYISAMGTDKLSQGMLAAWQADNINTDFVLRDEHRQPGLYLIQLDQQGERTFLYWRNQSAARYLLQHPDYSKALHAMSEADMVYLSGISLAVLPPEDRNRLIRQLAQLKQQGVKIAFDSNYRSKLWESVESARQHYAALLKWVDLALVTFDDENLLWGDVDEQATFTRLAQYGIETVVVKQGSLGATVQAQSKQLFVPTVAVENVVDTTSAGDSFNAGFLNGYLLGKDLPTCCRQGNAVAGIVIQHKGAIIDKTATAHLKELFA